MNEFITLLSILLVLILASLIWYINLQSYRVLRLAKKSKAYQPRIAVAVWFSPKPHNLASLELTLKSILQLNYRRLDKVLVMIDQESCRHGINQLAKRMGLEIRIIKPDRRRKLELVLSTATSAKLIINLEPGSTLGSKSLKASLGNFRSRQFSGLSLMQYGRLSDSLKTSINRQIAVLNRLFIASAKTNSIISTNGLIYRPSRVVNGRVRSVDMKGPYQFIEIEENQGLTSLNPGLIVVGITYDLFIVLNLISKSTEAGPIIAIVIGIAIALGLNISDRQPLIGAELFISQCLTTPYALIALPIIKAQQSLTKIVSRFKSVRRQSKVTT